MEEKCVAKERVKGRRETRKHVDLCSGYRCSRKERKLKKKGNQTKDTKKAKEGEKEDTNTTNMAKMAGPTVQPTLRVAQQKMSKTWN